MSESAALDVVVIGGGAAGLTAARELVHVGLTTLVVEVSDAVGGCVRSHDVAGITLDSGAESFATRGGTVSAFIDELGLTDAVVSPNPAGSWLHLPALRRGGSMSVPSPRNTLLGIPASPLADDVRAAIGARASFRAYLDRLRPVLTIGGSDRLGPLVTRRMGRAVLERLVSPISTGVYSADADELDIDVVAPGLNAAITRAGSLSGAVAELRSGARPGAAVLGIRGGVSRLIDAVAADIEHFGGEIRTSTRARDLQPTDLDGEPGWTLTLEGAGGAEQRVRARRVMIAASSGEAIRLLSTARTEWQRLARLDWPQPTTIELATLVIDAPALDAAPRGTGALVGSGTPGVSAKALTHVSAKWAWVAESLADDAGAGRHVLRLSYGRVGELLPTSGMSDEDVTALAVSDASAILGVPLDPAAVVGFARTRWTDAVSRAAVGQRQRVDEVREAIEDDETVAVVGSWVSGTGLASVIPDARETARRLRRGALHTDGGI